MSGAQGFIRVLADFGWCSVRVWQDVKCGVSIVLAAPSSAQSYHLAQLGVTVQLDDR